MAKIMLVEDDNNLREIYGARLLAEGHEIVTAKDGEEALAIAVKEKPELIISDVMMPKISGFDMLDILRNAPETKFTKVIMMTALSQTEDKARAATLGADRYLVKSQVTLEDVARVVREVLEGKTEPTIAPTGAVITDVPETTPISTEETPPTAETTPAVTEETPVETSAVEEPSAVPAPELNSEPTVETTTPEEPVTNPEPVETPAAFAIVEPTPEITPVTEPAPPVAPSSTFETSIATPISVTVPDATPAPTVVTPDVTETPEEDTPPTPQINVELPSLEPKAEEDPVNTATLVAQTPGATESSEENANIGPNLMQALQDEGAKPENEPNSVAPTITNGSEPSVITPTQPTAPEVSTEEITPVEAEVETTDVTSEEAIKKGIIQPINDISTGPDLKALLDKEEAKNPVEMPPANTVITPVGSTPTEASGAPAVAPAPPTEHDIISL